MRTLPPVPLDVGRPAPSGSAPRVQTRHRQATRRLGRRIPFLGVLLVAAVIATPGVVAQAPASRTHVAGALLVKWKDGPNSHAAVQGNKSLGAKVVRDFTEVGWQRVILPTEMSVTEGIAAYRALGTAEAVEPDYALLGPLPSRPAPSESPTEPESPSGIAGLQGSNPQPGTPNDPRYNSQWNLRKIGMPSAWSVTTGSSNVVVAIIDTGVNYLHEDLAANMWRNPGETGADDLGRDKATNGVDDDANGYVDDVHGIDAGNQDGDPMDRGATTPPSETVPYHHGTRVAGIIGAVGNNGKGITGINWTVQIMALKFVTDGWDQLDPAVAYTIWNSYLIECVDYILKMKRRGVNVRIVNNSYNVMAFSQAFEEAIAECAAQGILFVCAAGTSGVDTDAVYPHFPAAANLPDVLSVTASDENDSLLAVSNYGQTTVDLAAPGANITTTSAPGQAAYDLFGHTSAATPHVAGAAALLWTLKPGATLQEVTAALLTSVDRPASLRGKVRTNGRLNVARALQVLTNDNQPPIILHAFPHSFRTSKDESIRVHFSGPMERASVEAAFQPSPRVEGRFNWTPDSRTLFFTPNVSLSPTNYTVRLLGGAVDARGRSLDGNYDGATQGSPADDFVWTFKLPLSNDDIYHAEELVGESGQVKGSNRPASFEVYEPFYRWSGAVSVWYHWAPPRSGAFTFDLAGTSFDTMLDVFTMSGLLDSSELFPFERLRNVAHNNDYGTRKASRVSFLAEEGKTHYARVDGTFYSDSSISAMGSFTLSWSTTPAPRLTSFSPPSGAPGTRITLIGTDFTLATAVTFNGAVAEFTLSTNSPDQRLVATVPAGATTGPISVATPAGAVTSTSNFEVPAPALSARLAGSDQVELLWPDIYTGWQLESLIALREGLAWFQVLPEGTVPIADATGHWSVKVSTGGAHGFFRLGRRP